MRYYSYLIRQIEILHCNRLFHGCLDPNFILLFSNDDGVIILDALKSNFKFSNQKVIKNQRSISKEDDMWSIGMILLEMCLGYIPSDLDEYFTISREKIEELFRERNYSQNLIEIIIKLLIDRKIIFKKDRKAMKNRRKRNPDRLTAKKLILESKKLVYF